jgi:hypothetical protein
VQLPSHRIVKLSVPFNGLSSFVNVIHAVGPEQVNAPDDVKVVQRLLQMMGKGSQIAPRFGLPAVTGHFDAITGFWIYRTQSFLKKQHSNQIVDGIISPARGICYAPGVEYTIVEWNWLASTRDSDNYATFVQEYY